MLCKCLTQFIEVWALYELSLPTSHWLCDTVVSINPNIDPESDKWTASDVGADKGWCYRSLTNHTTPSAHKPFVLAPETTGWGVKWKDWEGEGDNKIRKGNLVRITTGILPSNWFEFQTLLRGAGGISLCVMQHCCSSTMHNSKFPYQLPLFWGQRWRLYRLVDRIRAAERVIEAVDLLKALVPLLVDALALWHLVEHRRLWLGVVLHKLHVLENWEMEID